MKIEHVNGEVTETDKLPDVEAMILEKVNELWLLCDKAERQLFLVVDQKGAFDGRGMTFYSIRNKGKDVLNMEQNQKCLSNLLSMISSSVKFLTNNKYSIK